MEVESHHGWDSQATACFPVELVLQIVSTTLVLGVPGQIGAGLQAVINIAEIESAFLLPSPLPCRILQLNISS